MRLSLIGILLAFQTFYCGNIFKSKKCALSDISPSALEKKFEEIKINLVRDLQEKKSLGVLAEYAYESDGKFYDGEFTYSHYSRSNKDGYLEERFPLKNKDKLTHLDREVDIYLDYVSIVNLIQNDRMKENTDNYEAIWFNDMKEPTLNIIFRFNEYNCSYGLYDLDLAGPR